MLERWTGMMGIKGGVLVALGLALAVPSVGCSKKKEESSEKDEKKSSKDDDTEKSSKKKKSGDDDDDDKDTKKKKKKGDDDDDSKSAKKAKAPKNVDDEDDDDDDKDDKDVPKVKGLKPIKGDTDLSGSWGVAGKTQDGKKYKGTAAISKIGGSMYKATWTIAGEKQQGIAFKDGNVLSCGWSPKHDLGVAAYLVKKGVLDGVWFEEQHTSLGNEILKGPAGDTVSGLYTITKGEMPGTKKKYDGTVDISMYKSGVFKITTRSGTAVIKGLGLRSNHFPGSDTDVLSTGFNDGGDAGVLQYIIYEGGKTMVGHWALPGKGSAEPTWGKETMVKAE
jgi:hypothetical protein